MYGLNLSIKRNPKAAAVHVRNTVLMLPERINDISKKVTKNTQAVPKSPITKSAPMHTAEKSIKPVRFFVV